VQKSRFSVNFLPLFDQVVTFAVGMTETHPQKRLFGYARVSTHGEALDA
jgi:hypothetical protein